MLILWIEKYIRHIAQHYAADHQNTLEKQFNVNQVSSPLRSLKMIWLSIKSSQIILDE